jgi:hypothetical protein
MSRSPVRRSGSYLTESFAMRGSDRTLRLALTTSTIASGARSAVTSAPVGDGDSDSIATVVASGEAAGEAEASTRLRSGCEDR